MTQNNQETTDNVKQQSSRKDGRRRRDQEHPTRSYKHVTLERKRPQNVDALCVDRCHFLLEQILCTVAVEKCILQCLQFNIGRIFFHSVNF